MVIETFTFRLKDGADEDAFLVADKRVQEEFMYQQPGFERRTTARGHDGEWIVVVLWTDHGSAERANELVFDSDAVKSFGSFIDDDSVRLARYESLD